MPSKVVEVPGVGNVEFPDSMSDDQIGGVIKQQHPELTQQKDDGRTLKDFVTSPHGFIREGLGRAGRGVMDAINTPGLDSKLKGASEVVRGLGTAAIPAAIPFALSNPISSAAALAAGTGAQTLAESGASALGAPPGASSLIGDVAGLGAGGFAGKKVSNIDLPLKVSDLGKVKAPTASTVGHSAAAIVMPFGSYHKTIAAKGIADMLRPVTDAVSNRRNIDLDARLRNFASTGGGNAPMPEPTYTDAPLTGYKTEAPVKAPTNDIPDWMKEPDIQEIRQQQGKSLINKPVEKPEVTQAKSNFSKAKDTPNPLKVEAPKNYEKLARQKAEEEFNAAPREWPEETPNTAPEVKPNAPVAPASGEVKEGPTAPQNAPERQQTAPGKTTSEAPKDEKVAQDTDPNKQYSWDDIKEKYGTERVKSTKAKLEDLSERLKKAEIPLNKFLNLPQEAQDAIVKIPKHATQVNRSKYSTGFHRGYSNLLKEIHGSE